MEMNQSLAVMLLPPDRVIEAIGTPNRSLLDTVAVSKRDELLELSHGLERVIGETSQRIAAEYLNKVDGMLKAAETNRKDVKDPFLTIGKRIDEAAKTFCAPLQAEKTRLKTAIGNYQAEQIRIAQEAERKQREELERLNRERLAAEAAAQLARTVEEQQKAQAAMLAADTKAAEVVMTASAPVPVKPSNLKVRQYWKVTVLDARALNKVFPELCEVTPKMRDVQAAVNKAPLDPKNPPVLPGCVIELHTEAMSK